MSNAIPVMRLPRAGMATFLLLITLAAPSAAAQDVPAVPTLDEVEGGFFGLALSTEQGYLEVGYNSLATTAIEVMDLSQDAGNPTSGAGARTRPHSVSLRLVNAEEIEASGWLMQFSTSIPQIYGGDRERIEVTVQATPLITRDDITGEIAATLLDPQTGQTVNSSINISAQVDRYSRALARIPAQQISQTAGQFDVVKYEVVVTNDAVYPDVFSIEAKLDKEDYIVVAPASIYLPPMTTRSFNVSVRTPYGSPYMFAESATLAVKVESVYTGASFPTTGILKIEGFYLSSTWLPLILVGMISAGVLERNRRKWRELRRLEKGRPRRVQPTPRQAVLLAELKRKDPEAYQERKARLDALYAARRQHYRTERRTIAAADKIEQRQAHLEYVAAKKAKKAARRAEKAQAKIDRKEAKKQRKIDAKAAKAQRKLDKKQAKAEAKEAKKLEKVLAKKRKQLEKAKAKAAKQEAKRAKAEARAAKKAERAAKKSAKGR